MLSAGQLVRAYGLVENEHLKKLAGDTEILAFGQENLTKIFEDNTKLKFAR